MQGTLSGLLINGLKGGNGDVDTSPWPFLARAVPAQRLATTEQSVVISCTRSISYEAIIEASSPPCLSSKDSDNPGADS